MQPELRRQKRKLRHLRTRKKLIGTEERPRLNVHRSHLHLHVQAVDDMTERTLCGVSTQNAVLHKEKRKQWGNVQAAKDFGAFAAEQLKKNKITRIVFDRGGRPYQGRIRAFADALRENGIQF